MEFIGIEIHTASDGRVDKMDGALKGMMSDIYLDQLADKTRRGMIGAFDRGGDSWRSLFRLCQRLGARPAGDR